MKGSGWPFSRRGNVYERKERTRPPPRPPPCTMLEVQQAVVLGGATTAPAPGNRHQRWAQTGVLVLTCKTLSYRRRQGCVVIVTSTEGRVCGRRPGCVVLVTSTKSPFGGSLFNIVHGGAGGEPSCLYVHQRPWRSFPKTRMRPYVPISSNMLFVPFLERPPRPVAEAVSRQLAQDLCSLQARTPQRWIPPQGERPSHPAGGQKSP